MSLRPTAIALDDQDGMYVVIDDPAACAGPLLIPCSWNHRRIDVSRSKLAEQFELHPAESKDDAELRSALQGFLDAWLNCDRKLTEADWEEMNEAERTARAALDASPSTPAHKEGDCG